MANFSCGSRPVDRLAVASSSALRERDSCVAPNLPSRRRVGVPPLHTRVLCISAQRCCAAPDVTTTYTSGLGVRGPYLLVPVDVCFRKYRRR